MKYLICQDYSNTTNNHAGIKHMCMLLKKYYPEQYEIIVFPDLYKNLDINTIYGKIMMKIFQKVLIPNKYKKIGDYLIEKAGDDDNIYLLEYFNTSFPQLSLAKYIKKRNNRITIYGMAHLVPEIINKQFSGKQFNKWVSSIDTILTLGSSLSNYFIQSKCVNEKKIKTLFHYVDLDYYKPLVTENFETKKRYPKILVMGNQKRNFNLLLSITKANPKIQFTICQGVIDLRDKFKNCNNVHLVGFIEEDELLSLMQHSDISLNIMDDTIGSNVIVTSMAVGLAMIVSDVGSIRDYCKEDGAIYCKNTVESFSDAINELFEKKNKLNLLKEKSLKYSCNFSIHNLRKLL